MPEVVSELVSEQAAGAADVPVRLVSYNICGLRAGVGAVAEVLRELDADVVCLQEAPRWLAWRGRSAALARRSHLLYAGGGGTAGGTAVLTAVRVDVREVQEYRLRRTPGLRRRGVVLAMLGKGRARFGVASFHLGREPAERARHLTDITGLVSRMVYQAARDDDGPSTHGAPPIRTAVVGGPVVVGGCVNESPGGLAWSRLTAQYDDPGAADLAPTFPAAHPRHRIDGVFVRGRAEVVSYQVVDSPLVAKASDHRPVVVDLLLPTG